MSSTITIRSRCHEYDGEWFGERLTVMSGCHQYAGEWVPERGSPALLAVTGIALANGRPGAVEPAEPQTPPPHYTKQKLQTQYRVHWDGHDRCPTKRLMNLSGSGES